MTRVKICGLRNRDEALYAQDCGADYLGFVFEPTSVRYVGSSEWAPDWLSEIAIPKVAVFGSLLHEAHNVFDYVQAFDWPSHLGVSATKIQVVRWRPDHEAFQPAMAPSLMLFDSFHPTLAGGAGETADWDQMAEDLHRYLGSSFVAGGLTPENVGEAIRKLSPWGVDVSSGVESEPGKKDFGRIKAFIDAVRQAN